jgi:hypothetical protein
LIEVGERMIEKQNNVAVNRHFKLEIKTLQDAPIDEDKMQQLLKIKVSEKQEPMRMEDTQKG